MGKSFINKKNKMVYKQKREVVENWIRDNGAISVNLKEGYIYLHNGGLFSIDKTIKLEHPIKFIPCKNKQGYSELIHDKTKPKERTEYYTATMWMEDLDSVIKHLQSLKRMLNNIGYRTSFTK